MGLQGGKEGYAGIWNGEGFQEAEYDDGGWTRAVKCYSSLKMIRNALPDGDLLDLEVVMSAEEVMKYKVDDFAKHIVDKIWEAHKIKVYKKNQEDTRRISA